MLGDSGLASLKNLPFVHHWYAQPGSSTTAYTSPGRQQYHPSAAKFWLSMDLSGTQTILASYNVTSISDGGVGISDVTIATDFSTANWCSVMACQPDVGVAVYVGSFGSKAAGSVRVYSNNSSSFASADATDLDIAGFGDQ